MSTYCNHTQHSQNRYLASSTLPPSSNDENGGFTAINQQSNNRYNATQSPRRIAELIIPCTQQSHSILSPIAASLSKHNEQQWTTWITHRTPSKTLLKQMGAELSRLRIIVIDKSEDARWLVWQALAQGNSHSIIAEQNLWTVEDIQSMQTAASKGACEALLVTVH